MLGLFLVPMTIISIVPFTSVTVLFCLYIVSGLGMAGIGMGIMHDALHGAYSKNRKVNKWLGYTINLIGANHTVWSIQHNVLHHSYTNIHGLDDDINAPFFLRFSPFDDRNRLHKYQHYYAWFLYGFMSMAWLTTKDFIRLKRYYELGLIKNAKDYRAKVWNSLVWKIVYFTFCFFLPVICTDFPVWIILLAFLSKHFITGIIISVVFQVAHVMPSVDFPQPNEQGEMQADRLIHQMFTTSNFSPKSKLFSWLIGGLNFQVEHHLFPNISHVHYRNLAPLVQKTAQEFGIPYHCEQTFFAAICNHYRMLRILGRE